MPDAQRIVDGLAVKEYPVIMEFDGDIFITRHDLKAKQEVLVLLNKYLKADFDFLFSKTRDRNSSRFRSTLDNMIMQKLIGKKGEEYFLMPRGADIIRNESLLTYA